MNELLPALDASCPSRRLDPLSARLQLVRDMSGRDVLFESWDGEIVAYALGASPSNAICTAVLSRSSRPLRSALRETRKVALAAAGTVRTGQIDGQTATVVPVPRGPAVSARAAGQLWLFGPETAHIDATLHAVITELGALATRLSQVHDLSVSDLIQGSQALPAHLTAGTTSLLLARSDLPPGAAVETLRHAVRDTPARLLLHAGVHDGTDVAIVSSDRNLPVEVLAAHLSDPAIRHGFRCVLIDSESSALGAAFQQGQAILRVAPAGCWVPAQLRARLFVRRISDAVSDPRDAGTDGVAALLISHPDFARALLTWLDTHGDAAATAAAMACHVNTIRYRLRRAGQLLHGDLQDPIFRLEVHLRLLAALHETGHPDA